MTALAVVVDDSSPAPARRLGAHRRAGTPARGYGLALPRSDRAVAAPATVVAADIALRGLAQHTSSQPTGVP
ncbi:MAG TPA: hypothetical protein VFH02_13350 [Jiangellaceae bacterium]|nr:hypothetical protein [Jiangellaceae bacterium]